MPAWWGKKSSKNKEESPQNQSPLGTTIGFLKYKNNNSNPKSLDDGGGHFFTTRNSPRASKDFGFVGGGSGGGSSGFSGFDSDSGEKRGIPLPRPSFSSMQNDHVVGLGSGSPSVSSVSSSGSSEDNQIANDPVQFLANRFFFFFFIYTYILDSEF